jgi:hypothetical protein
MGQVPSIRRIVAESFKDVPWIGRLAYPINTFMEQTISLFQKNLSFTDNFDGQVLDITADGQYPLLVKWDSLNKPKAVWIGAVYRTNGENVSYSAALFLKWTFNESRQIEISDIIGLDDSNTVKYNVTIIGVTG